MERDRSSTAARQLLAEGQLCKGLEDEPAALDAAIRLLQKLVDAQPTNFFAQLDLADALRKRFPLSEEALAALVRARVTLDQTDVGVARQELSDYIGENLGAVREQRARLLPVLEHAEAAYAAGTLSPIQLAELVSQLVLTGPEGLSRAATILDTYVAQHPDTALETLYRAEIWRGRISAAASRAQYSAAEIRLCDGCASPSISPQCALVQLRLEQLGGALAGNDAACDRRSTSAAGALSARRSR